MKMGDQSNKKLEASGKLLEYRIKRYDNAHKRTEDSKRLETRALMLAREAAIIHAHNITQIIKNSTKNSYDKGK